MDILSLYKQTEDHEGVDPSDLSFGFRQLWPKTGSICKEEGDDVQPGCHKSTYFNKQKQCFLHAFSFTDSVRPATGRASYIRTLRTLTPPPGVATNQRPKTENRKLITEDRRPKTADFRNCRIILKLLKEERGRNALLDARTNEIDVVFAVQK